MEGAPQGRCPVRFPLLPACLPACMRPCSVASLLPANLSHCQICSSKGSWRACHKPRPVPELKGGGACTCRCAIGANPKSCVCTPPHRRKKYAAVSPSAFGINSGKKRIVVIRAGGPILGGGGAPSGGQIKADAVIKQMRAVEKDKVRGRRHLSLSYATANYSSISAIPVTQLTSAALYPSGSTLRVTGYKIRKLALGEC